MAEILGYFLTKYPAWSHRKWTATLLGQLDDHNDQDDHENEMVPPINLHSDLDASVVLLE